MEKPGQARPGDLDEAGAAKVVAGSNEAPRDERRQAEQNPMPFLVEVRQVPEPGYRTDRFRPEARVLVTPGLRESGLWGAMPQEMTRDLLLLLTFVTANGVIAPTLQQVAASMNVPACGARTRMRRLASFEWGGRPAVTEVPRGSGMDAYAVSPKIAAVRHVEPEYGTDRRDKLAYRPAGREAVIAYSRSRYARPLAEVERIVEEQLHGSPARQAAIPEVVEALTGGPDAYRDLLALGVLPDDAERLVVDCGPEAVARQVAWLPYRNARRPERFVVASIEGGYDEPLQARQAAEREREQEQNDEIETAPLEREIAAQCEDEANLHGAESQDAITLQIPPSSVTDTILEEGQRCGLPPDDQ